VDKKDFGKRLDIAPTASPGYVSRAQLRQETLDLTETLLRMPNAMAPRADGSVANPVLADQMLRKLLATHSFGELARYVPEPPNPPKLPGEEHQSWLEGMVPEPSPLEDHAKHIAQHELFLTLSAGRLDEETQRAALMHVRETQILLRAKMQMAEEPPKPFAPGVPTFGGEDKTDFSGQPPLGSA
jgi:hypothetical protein